MDIAGTHVELIAPVFEEDAPDYWVSLPHYQYIVSTTDTVSGLCTFTIEAIINLDVGRSGPAELILRVTHRLANFGAKPLLEDLIALAGESFLLMSAEFDKRNPLNGSPGEILFLSPEKDDVAAGVSKALESAYPASIL